MNPKLINNARIINENNDFTGSVLIGDEKIKKVFSEPLSEKEILKDWEVIDATGLILIPGIIDDHVHFREPGLTQKADIYSESKAAIAGGVTSFMEMPNTKPATTSIHELEKKYELAKQKSFANYSFYFGATNNNFEEIQKINPSEIPGIKLFMGSSTGNMLIDNENTLSKIFAESPKILVSHCEDEKTIKDNTEYYKKKFDGDIPFKNHPLIRSEEACYKSSSKAIKLAKKYNTRLHILHLSTAKELELFNEDIPLEEKKITGEVCIHHLWFNDTFYKDLGYRIKWNPAVKKQNDQIKLLEGLINNKIDVIATDHAPHLLKEKQQTYLKSPSGGPMIQHSLLAMMEFFHENKITVNKIVEKMCHNPAKLFKVKKRGFIKEGYWADLVLIDPGKTYNINTDNILYKCKWSPMENLTFKSSVSHTFINGHLAYEKGNVSNQRHAKRIEFQ